MACFYAQIGLSALRLQPTTERAFNKAHEERFHELCSLDPGYIVWATELLHEC